MLSPFVPNRRAEATALDGVYGRQLDAPEGWFTMCNAFLRTCYVIVVLLEFASTVLAGDYERRDITFPSEDLKCAAWYYVPSRLEAGEKRPVIVMANGYSAVRDPYLDSYAQKFAAAGFVVLAFDYRHLGASEGDPRQQIFWYDQIMDYRNAITWASLQPEVDPARIGVWGTSYSGGHVMHLAAFDKRVNAVVSQVPFTGLPAEMTGSMSGWFAKARTQRMTSGEIAYFPVVAANGQAALPQPESYQWFMGMAKLTSSWVNRVTVESLEIGMGYDPTAYIQLISPTPLLMVIASEDIVTPTERAQKAFDRAGEPKRLVVVPARHYEAYSGPKHMQFFSPQLEWFEQHLMRR